ncbi:serine/threonine-protein kinase [Polyangium mundeleinium]|uniref:Serine/threonine-protein kinase n=1 Tax=Polyangium mundeleinium TaxID=2995306 RepID=A0ABT5EYF2_9BACT|nr:serine/threonine-protein kinase [Polyangium mundeleinium]MDC0746193.1 serine/threonine-protein kinase [Polyangium mundeleinium]
MNEGDLVAGRYRLLRPIGRGAMGTVWAGRHELLGRDFALKFASLPLRAGPETRARFLREAQAIGRLRHPNVVDVADFGEVAPGGGLYLAMELLEGQSLAARIEEQGALRPAEAVAVAAEIARGLAAAHTAGIVHRDIKPENIFLARGMRGGLVPKLLDFGISKQQQADETPSTLNGVPFGTPAYMSPEQALGELDVDHRSDVWSLGVVLHEMIAGKHPFVAPNYQALMTKIAESPAAPLDTSVPQVVRGIVTKCLQKNPADRYADADALATALEDALGRLGPSGDVAIERPRALPSLRPPASADTTHASPSKRGPALVAAVIAAALLAGLAAVGLGGRRDDAEPPAPSPPPSAPKAEALPTPQQTALPTAAPSAAPTTTTTHAPGTPRTANTVTHTPSGSTSGKASGPAGKRPTTNVNDPGF